MGSTRLTAREVLDRAMTESQLQSAVIDLAHRYGWLVQHSRPVHDGKRWLTPIQGDPGYPDLTLAKVGHTPIHAELKIEVGWHWKPGQREWAEALGAVLWRPSDLPEIERRLSE